MPDSSHHVALGPITAFQRDTGVWVRRAASAIAWSCCHLLCHWLQGWRQACTDDASLALGVNTHGGHLVNAAVGEATGLDTLPLGRAHRPLDEYLPGGLPAGAYLAGSSSRKPPADASARRSCWRMLCGPASSTLPRGRIARSRCNSVTTCPGSSWRA